MVVTTYGAIPQHLTKKRYRSSRINYQEYIQGKKENKCVAESLAGLAGNSLGQVAVSILSRLLLD